MAAFVGMLSGYFPDIGGHLVAASVMSAPAALALAKIMVPETERSVTADVAGVQVEREDVNVVEAAARGASEGLWLALNVAAMLIAFLALLALVNATIGWAGGFAGYRRTTIVTASEAYGVLRDAERPSTPQRALYARRQ